MYNKIQESFKIMNDKTTGIIDTVKEKIQNKSQYQKVIDFHKCAGHPFNDEIQKNYILDKPDRVKLRVDLIKEELSELEDAVRDNNLKEIIDALSDILYVTHGMGIELGIDLDKSFDIVHNSNMTKFCKSEQEAIDTVKWYEANDKRYDSPDYRKSPDNKHWVVYNKSTDKALKSIKYTPANFDTMLLKGNNTASVPISDVDSEKYPYKYHRPETVKFKGNLFL